MKKLICLIIIGVLLESCMITSERYSKFVDQKTMIESEEFINRDWLLINTPEFDQKGNHCEQIKSLFVPAIVYWEWNSTIECEIDPNKVSNYIKKAIHHTSNRLDLKNKLNGKQLTINLQEIPGRFLYENKGNAVILIFAYFMTGVEDIFPDQIDLVAEYEISENGKILTKGKKVVKNLEQPLGNIWSSTKKFAWNYLDIFKDKIDQMAEELIKDIADQIEYL